jgi:hypothetical protein
LLDEKVVDQGPVLLTTDFSPRKFTPFAIAEKGAKSTANIEHSYE